VVERLPEFTPVFSDDPNAVFSFIVPIPGGELPPLESAVVRAAANCRQVVPATCAGQATGVTRALAELGIDKRNAMAFGDDTSDIGMLRDAVEIGVAMGNASPAVKEVATYVTASIDEEGVAKALQHFDLA
jgi:hydroxymethylpyrimidine pyrophosphatase-like HAD family hydrolase